MRVMQMQALVHPADPFPNSPHAHPHFHAQMSPMQGRRESAAPEQCEAAEKAGAIARATANTVPAPPPPLVLVICFSGGLI
mmetsp:Transcript_2168/g.6252  ORF Transcript_2168/g.6252 Transcript_2168/m.6252 type:complete len:81 (+) Transcript_2168:290-532(+)